MEKRLKIVIADDSEEFGQSCAKAFKAYGMQVVLCEKDGKKVIEYIKKEKPDVVLADVFMHNLDILGVLEVLKDMDDKPMITVMSSFDNQRLEKETLEAGAAYYFLKPFDINTLAERIIRLSGWKNDKAPLIVKNNVVI